MTLYNISERYENILEVQNELTQDEFKITKTETKVDKKALKEYLKNNTVDYAYLESKQSLMIK